MFIGIVLDPFNMGFEAFHKLISRNRNPFPKNSNEHDSWNHGWDNAIKTVAWGDEDDWREDDDD
jgi:hypothetical protein